MIFLLTILEIITGGIQFDPILFLAPHTEAAANSCNRPSPQKELENITQEIMIERAIPILLVLPNTFLTYQKIPW